MPGPLCGQLRLPAFDLRGRSLSGLASHSPLWIFSPTAEAWGLSQTRHWGTVGQSSGEVP